MAKSINEVLLMGNLTRDPEYKEFDSGKAKTSFSLALNRSYKDGDGIWQEATDYVDCVAWGTLAGQIQVTARRGLKVLVTGRIQSETWEQDGVKKSKLVILAEDVTFVGKVLAIDALKTE